MSNILDKPTESLFGYIGVLVSVSHLLLIFGILIWYICSPELSLHIGTSIVRWLRDFVLNLVLSRYIALQNDKNGQGPLASYFKGEVLHGRDTDIFTSNMCMSCFALLMNLILRIACSDLAEDVESFPDVLQRSSADWYSWVAYLVL